MSSSVSALVSGKGHTTVHKTDQEVEWQLVESQVDGVQIWCAEEWTLLVRCQQTTWAWGLLVCSMKSRSDGIVSYQESSWNVGREKVSGHTCWHMWFHLPTPLAVQCCWQRMLRPQWPSCPSSGLGAALTASLSSPLSPDVPFLFKVAFLSAAFPAFSMRFSSSEFSANSSAVYSLTTAHQSSDLSAILISWRSAISFLPCLSASMVESMLVDEGAAPDPQLWVLTAPPACSHPLFNLAYSAPREPFSWIRT